MTEETIILVLLSVVMFVGSFLAGMIPLVIRLNEDKLKKVSVLGAGLLVGTALSVIIPEGIRSLRINETTGHSEDFSKAIGGALSLGFVLMMLVDQISQRHMASKEKNKNITATLGLVVHAAADGVALGAAATTSHQDVEIIVFIAIMLHKAPAAFGLVSFLLHEQFDRNEIRRHLAVFSLSAPLTTVLVYFGIGQEQKDTLNSINATGIAMLFSAGTFLYVATVHVLPELMQRDHPQPVRHLSTGGSQCDYSLLEEAHAGNCDVSFKPSSATAASAPKQNSLRYSELVIIICGVLMPLVMTFNHHH